MASRGLTVFHEDNGFRDMFIYGSVAMLAALALPSKKAHAAEFYLCGDGRMLELTNANRTIVQRQDKCVTSWYVERQKSANTKAGKPADDMPAVAQSTGYQIQTSAIEPLINAIEVPEGHPMASEPAKREKIATDRRARREPARKTVAANRPQRGLRHMGDGIYAE